MKDYSGTFATESDSETMRSIPKFLSLRELECLSVSDEAKVRVPLVCGRLIVPARPT